ncbi:hypothetical protein [Paraburkholderia lycopersici]|uniref:Uncharacterized protein n=1 Tax=Paraburkholderia lycopersici TaxID=416944 RepID=A0A1G6HBQ4_9BURK|nr:hypothetical protein [Paraburkholderia lycopersici]SDB91518.1 hypothetical protein SAMN05421548_102133 [Paraburkholderia lycopersici]
MKQDAFSSRDVVVAEGSSAARLVAPALVERYTVELIRPSPGVRTPAISVAMRKDTENRRASRAVRDLRLA